MIKFIRASSVMSRKNESPTKQFVFSYEYAMRARQKCEGEEEELYAVAECTGC